MDIVERLRDRASHYSPTTSPSGEPQADPDCELDRHAANEIETLRAQLNEANEVLERLPKTADGVSVVPMTDAVYHPKYKEGVPLIIWSSGQAAPRSNRHAGGIVPVSECYTTPEAAHAAREESK